ncbi:ATP-binding protein [Massilia sp. YMA4]|uniref:hybrid sensor histidine kinase/response regulator n=1 Tax=Massilia sp. YMA4 TaxID=1593482 RepID=UPI000DD10AC1|nr:ATP-binding protein [Massilia sp. YMA4]AXA89950.1 hybrid sensor histidine kinase/response regulator [Massilia sp. YMA4]
MRIRNRLLLLILSILVPAFAIASVAVWYVYKEQRAADVAGMQEAARALALLADRELQTKEAVLRTLAASPAMQAGDLAAVYRHARALMPPADGTIVVHDLAGRQLFNTRQPYGSPPAQGRSNLMTLRQAAGPHATVVSDLFHAPVGKRYDVALQIPVFVGDALRCYLSMGMTVERIAPLLGQQGVPANWVVSLLDRRGSVIARSRDASRYIGRQVSPGLRASIAASPAGMHQGVRLDGTPTFAFYSRAPMSGWTVVMSVPVAEMRRPAFVAAAGLGLLVTVVLLLAVGAARVYARGTAAPIEQLRLAAERLGRDEPVAPFASGVAEADAVSAALADASARIRDSKAHLERRVAAAVAAAERAQRALLQGQKLEALGRLTAGIAHDFNNILQTLSGALQLIGLTDDRARVQALAATCQKAIGRATTLTGQMRAFGTVQDARLETIQPDLVLESTLPMLRSALPGTVQVELDVAPGLWPVTIDPLQLELALLNLVINARDAMPDGGRLHLAMHNEQLVEDTQGLAPGPYVRIELRDNGTGMAPETLARALEPFFTTKPLDKGTGLGLPQAYAFATQSGGTLTLQSALGAGTTATIRLPRGAGENAAPEGAGTAGGATGPVLFVDDDPLVRATMVEALTVAGFDVTAAASGDEALARLEAGCPVRHVVSDIVMPGTLDGVGLAKVVAERFPGIRVVLATGHTERRVSLPGVRLLAKPYDLAQLFAALEA